MRTTALAVVLLHGLSGASASTGRTCTGAQTWAAAIAELTDANTYDKNMRPTLALQPTVEADAGVVAPPDELKVQLFITSVTLIDGKNSLFGLAGYQRQYWKDERLAYSNTTEGGCFDEINVGEGDWGGLWMPDTYSDNSLKVQLGENLLFIYPDGNIWLSQRFVQQYECKMNFAQMPFDEQQCDVILTTYAMTGLDVVMTTPDGSGVDGVKASTLSNVEWNITDLHSDVSTTIYGVPPNEYPWYAVNIHFDMVRLNSFYFTAFLLPAFFFVVISYTGFFINRNVAPARVAIAVIPVLITSGLLGSLRNSMPRVAYGTWITDYMFCTILFNCLNPLHYAYMQYVLQAEAAAAGRLANLKTMSTELSKKMKANNVKAEASGRRKTEIEDIELRDLGDDVTSKSTEGIVAGITNAARSQSAGGADADVDVDVLDSEELILLQALFEKLDTDSGGSLGVSELRLAFRFFGIYITSKQTQEVLEKVDDDKSGELDFNEFVRLMSNLSTDWESYKPRVDFNSSFWSASPSLQVDLLARYTYLPMYLLMVVLFGILAATGAYQASDMA